MTKIKKLFHISKGEGGYQSELAPGATPLVSCKTDNNGVLSFVDLEPIFKAPAITVNRVSATAFVQLNDFVTVPDDMYVLEPLNPMDRNQLYMVASLITGMSWRFSYYRKLTPTRLGDLEIPFDRASAMNPIAPELYSLIPARNRTRRITAPLNLKPIDISTLFDIIPGSIHNASEYSVGKTPLISCSDWNNGILGFYDIEDVPIHSNALTVAFNGSPLTAKYHNYRFAAKDDVAVLNPKVNTDVEIVLYAMAWLNDERWRYSYYRKCYQQKLIRLSIPMPVDGNGQIDGRLINRIVRGNPYWQFLSERWTNGDS